MITPKMYQTYSMKTGFLKIIAYRANGALRFKTEYSGKEAKPFMNRIDFYNPRVQGRVIEWGVATDLEKTGFAYDLDKLPTALLPNGITIDDLYSLLRDDTLLESRVKLAELVK